MEHALVALGIFAVWQLAAYFLVAPEWFWMVLPLALGVGGQALINADKLWLGLGLGGAAILITRVADLLLVAADWVKVAVLRTGPSQSRR